MPATHPTRTFSSPLANNAIGSAQCVLPRKCEISEGATSPLSFNETFINSPSERVISPKKKAQPDECASGEISKWESHVVANVACALDCVTADECTKYCGSTKLEPIAFSATPVGDLAAYELHILQHFLA